jgi:hypothetical protein
MSMAATLRMRRSRGAFSGFLLVLLGLWGALIPFIGPYFNYAYTPDVTWHYDTARLWLEILPGAAVFLGGVLLIMATGRHTALFGGLLAGAAGAWFVLGTTLSPLWNNNVVLGGTPSSSREFIRVMEQLGFFYALGVVVVLVAGVALGRIVSVPSGIREVETVPADETVPVERVPADTVPVERVPAETVPVERVPAETAQEADRQTEFVPVGTAAHDELPRRTGPADETDQLPHQTVPADGT